MIVSHRHKFIFIKTGKTAGTSIEVALEQLCGPEDICTPLAKREVERSSLPGEGDHRPRNWQGRFWPAMGPGVPLDRTVREAKDALRGRKYFNHMSADQVRRRIGRGVWDSYFKFCFERNPWDKSVSAFFWERDRLNVPKDFADWLKVRGPDTHFDLYSIEGQVAVDYVGKFEQLQEDLAAVLGKLGLEAPDSLPRTKTGFRPEGRERSYREMYTDETREIVARACAREIALFGYEF